MLEHVNLHMILRLLFLFCEECHWDFIGVAFSNIDIFTSLSFSNLSMGGLLLKIVLTTLVGFIPSYFFFF